MIKLDEAKGFRFDNIKQLKRTINPRTGTEALFAYGWGYSAKYFILKKSTTSKIIKELLG